MNPDLEYTVSQHQLAHLRTIQQNNLAALSTLQTYNAEDALILEPLLVDAFNRELELRPEFALEALTSRPQPRLMTEVDPEIYAYLKFAPSSGMVAGSAPFAASEPLTQDSRDATASPHMPFDLHS